MARIRLMYDRWFSSTHYYILLIICNGHVDLLDIIRVAIICWSMQRFYKNIKINIVGLTRLSSTLLVMFFVFDSVS